MRARQTPRGSMAQSEASSDDEDAQSPPKEGQEKRLQDSIQNDIKAGADEAVTSGNRTTETPAILKTSP